MRRNELGGHRQTWRTWRQSRVWEIFGNTNVAGELGMYKSCIIYA